MLSHDEHLAAHNCSEISDKKGYHSPTNGYYDAKTNTIQSFGDGPPRAPKVIDLSNARLNEQTRNEHAYLEQCNSDKMIIKDGQDMIRHRMLERLTIKSQLQI